MRNLLLFVFCNLSKWDTFCETLFHSILLDYSEFNCNLVDLRFVNKERENLLFGCILVLNMYYKVVLYGLVKSEILSLITMSVQWEQEDQSLLLFLANMYMHEKEKED